MRGSVRQVAHTHVHDNIFTARMSLLLLQMLSEALNSLPELICIDSYT